MLFTKILKWWQHCWLAIDYGVVPQNDYLKYTLLQYLAIRNVQCLIEIFQRAVEYIQFDFHFDRIIFPFYYIAKTFCCRHNERAIIRVRVWYSRSIPYLYPAKQTFIYAYTLRSRPHAPHDITVYKGSDTPEALPLQEEKRVLEKIYIYWYIRIKFIGGR